MRKGVRWSSLSDAHALDIADSPTCWASRHNMISAGYHLDPHANDKFYSKKLEWNGESHVWVPNYDYLNFQI